MKTVYLVRHAESLGNVGPIRQGPDTPLSEKGVKQAKLLAERFKHIHVDKVLVSPFLRTKQTAEAIAEVLQKEHEFNDSLIERLRPSKVIGVDKNHPDSLEVDRVLAENFHDPEFRYSDEETFADLKRRALSVLDQLSKSDAEHILVVTHGVFLRMLAACVVLGEDLNSYEYKKFHSGLAVANTGITVFKQVMRHGEEIWCIESWNDSAHLGELSTSE
jgi:2,3-bisphosphoglycerate-dependent phosphoglycerate mutase